MMVIIKGSFIYVSRGVFSARGVSGFVFERVNRSSGVGGMAYFSFHRLGSIRLFGKSIVFQVKRRDL